MILEVNDTADLLIVRQADHIEESQLRIISSATPAPTFKGRGKPKIHDPICFFFNRKFLPIGLLFRIIALKDQKYEVHIKGLSKLTNKVDREELNRFIDTLDLPFDPHYYQRIAVANFLQFRKVSQSIGTSGGKTFIFYLTLRALNHYQYRNIKQPKFLAIVPTVQLVEQMHDDFADYQETETLPELNVYKIHGSAYNELGIGDCQVVCSTFHSLQEMPKEFFDKFDAVFVDESHQAKIFSITEVMRKLTHTQYRIGMTGSKPEDAMDLLNMESYVGGVAFEHPVWKMHRDGHVNDFEIIELEIIHSHQQTDEHFAWLQANPAVWEDKSLLRRSEQEYIFNNKKRNDTIAKLAAKFEMNTIILCSRVPAIKNHAESQYELKEAGYHQQHIHKVHGEVMLKDRLDILEAVKSEISGHIINAHIKCIGTGTSVKTLVYAIFDGIGKSFYATMQAVGRMLRKHPDKGKAFIIDVTDVMLSDHPIDGRKQYVGNNYSVRHKKVRMKTYADNKFPINPNKLTIRI